MLARDDVMGRKTCPWSTSMDGGEGLHRAEWPSTFGGKTDIARTFSDVLVFTHSGHHLSTRIAKRFSSHRSTESGPAPPNASAIRLVRESRIISYPTGPNFLQFAFTAN